MIIDTTLAPAPPQLAAAVAAPQVGSRVTTGGHKLVLLPDGSQGYVRWLFTNCGDTCANVQRIGGTPVSVPVRMLVGA